MLEVLHQLPTSSLRALAASLRGGILAAGVTQRTLQQIAGGDAAGLEACLTALRQTGMTPAHMAVVVETIADTRDRAPDPVRLFDLVLSGPDVPGVPSGDTAATMHAMVGEAQVEVLLVGYAVHQCRGLFERLAARMQSQPALRVVFCLDIPRPYGDTSMSSEIVRRFANEFRAKHWPWPALPELHYDPRSLSENMEERSSLHAKCLVIDRRAALVTSANFTEAAQYRNIEAGVMIRHPLLAGKVAEYFHALIRTGQFVQCMLR